MNGFRFECTLCGDCCRRPGLVAIADDELARIADYLDVEPYELVTKCDLELVDGAWQMEIVDGECVFLDGDRCGIQPVKPRQCRAYPFWPEIVDEPGAWEQEKEHCPGIGRGAPVPLDEIERLLSLLD